MESSFKRYKRYFKYLCEYVFCERLHGLDFSMRDLSLYEQSGKVFHGYSKTDAETCNKILEYIISNFDFNHYDILDVGCGKGMFLREATKYPQCLRIGGIEIDERLVKIARRNFQILKLQDKVNVSLSNATEFEEYGGYNVFYFFNPFAKQIMEKVLYKIFSECKYEFLIILYNPIYQCDIEQYGGKLEAELFDEVKSYKILIYKCKNY